MVELLANDSLNSSESLRTSEVRYRRLFETAQDAIFILNGDSGRITDANPYISQLLGYSHAEFVGKELWEIGLFRDIEASRLAYSELKRTGYIRYDHLPLHTKDGRQVEVEFVSNVYEVDDETVIQCNIRDITERSRLERQTQEQAVALADISRRKDEFLAMLSHELRNPLSSILNAVYLLRLQRDEDLIQQQARNIIERQVGHLARLVDDLLEISRITIGNIQLRQERLDLRGIVEQAVETVRPLIDRRKQELAVTLPSEPVWLIADPTRLEQVVGNLLGNAAKYTDEGGSIWLTLEQEGEAVLRVRDTGMGIAPELLPRIFDLFTQADRSSDRSQGGLGIGLTLVDKLVGMHGGTVKAFSAGLGLGSELTVCLPLAGIQTRPYEPPAGAEPSEVITGSSRVLVVDDNMDAADSMATWLQLAGHDVRTAYGGPAALEAAVAYSPTIVLLDIGLPGMDGHEVARLLRQTSGLENAWLIALTGYGRKADIQMSEEAGFDHHLVKPADPQKLRALLAELSNRVRS
ncbi:MAG TPA: ATP-binding protein [Thermoanaerobaculia bacterium]|nr:ATP-binding protein [Thermoanaerobaculia bacterium]